MHSIAQNGAARPAPARDPGDHGTGEQAIAWILHHSPDSGLENVAFLRAWEQGNAEAEWPDFYVWLDGQRARGAV